MAFEVRNASIDDVPLILSFIRQLAEYERLSPECAATEEGLRQSLFGARRYAEVVIGFADERPVGFALYFHNYSTFLARPGLYLEDLFVVPEMRGRGYGKALLVHLARIARDRGCGRFEWAVLDWNKPSIDFYLRLGAIPMSDWTTYRVTGQALEKLASMPVAPA